MATEKLVVDYNVRDKASADLKKVRKGLKSAEKGLDDTSTAMGKAGKSSKGLGTKLGDLKVGTMAAMAGIQQLHAKVSASVEAYIGAKDAATSYEFTLKNMGASAKDLAASNELISKTVDAAGIGYDVQQKSMSDLVLRLGDTKEAMDWYSLAVDASVASGEDLAAVSKKVGQAATGQVEPLMEMGILTQEQSRELAKLTSASDRAAAAMVILRDKVGGATASMDPQIRNIKAMRVEMDSVSEAMGHFSLSAANAAGSVATLGAANDEAGSFLSGLAASVEKSAKGLDVVSDAMANMSAGTPEQATLFHMMRVGFGQWESSGDSLKDTLGDVSKEQLDLTIATNEAIGAYGLQSQEADKAGEALRDYLKDQEALKRGVEGSKNALGDYTAALVVSALAQSGAAFKEASGVSATEFFNGFTEGVQEEFAMWEPVLKKVKKKKKTSKPSAPGAPADPTSPLSSIIDGAQAEAEADAAKAAALDWRNYVSDAQFDILHIKEMSAKAEAKYLLELDQIEQELNAGKITRTESKLQSTQAYFDVQKALDHEQANRQRDLDGEKKLRDQEQHAQKLRRIQEQEDAYKGFVANMRSMGQAISSAISSASIDGMEGLGGLYGSITDIGSNYALAGKKAKASGQAQEQAAAAGAQSVAAFAASQGASQKVLNGIMGIAATAQGFLSIAYGNIPGSIAAFTSAAIYGANAAMGGSGGSQASVAAPSAPQGPSRAESYEGMYQANLRALKDARDEGKETNVYNFSGATFLDGNVAAQRRVDRAMSRASRMTMGAQ